MADLVTALLTYGPLGIFCAVLWMAYQKEKSQVKELNDRIQELLGSHSKQLDAIRMGQTEREREVSKLLKDYGESIVRATEGLQDLAERIWSIRQ